MRRIKYIKSIDKYLNEDTFFKILEDTEYKTPIRKRFKSGHIDISKQICDLVTFSDYEIQEIEDYCRENCYFRREIRKTDTVNMILLWGKKTFFDEEMDDDPYLYQTTQAHITYTITSQDGSLLIAGDFPSELLDRKFGHRYLPYLKDLRAVLLNSGWFEEIKIKIKNRLSRDYFYEKIGDNSRRLKLIDMSDDELINIAFIRYKDRDQLFKVVQDDIEDEGVMFYIRLDDGEEAFEYSRYILTQEEFRQSIENVINSLEPYRNFQDYRRDLEDVLEQIEN